MKILDPRCAKQPFYTSWVAPALNDPRDACLVGVGVRCVLAATCGTGLLCVRTLHAPLVCLWLVLLASSFDRFTLMLHCVSHRPLWKPRYRALDAIVPYVIGPFFGQTPHSYFIHHVGMHHVEQNLRVDTSSTLRYRRDRFDHFLRYWARFMLLGLPDLGRYLKHRGRDKLRRKLVLSECCYLVVLALLLSLRPLAALLVLLLPLLVARTLMMMGNWAQHAFVAPDRADDRYVSSITCINTRYNRRCFNDGYHTGHHLRAHAHWTELPGELERNLTEYGRHDAIVFEGLDFFEVFCLLMAGRWSRLAAAFVQLPEALARNQEQVVALLKERVLPIRT